MAAGSFSGPAADWRFTEKTWGSRACAKAPLAPAVSAHMSSRWPNSGGFRPVPGGSLPPKLRSIFTLRPVSHTEQPPPEPPKPDDPEGSPGPSPRSRARWLAVTVVGLTLAGAAVFAWRSAPSAPKTVVFVNGAAKAKETPNGSQQRWASGEVTVVIDSSFDTLGPGAREAVQTAFGTWVGSGAKLPNLRFDSANQLKATVGQDGVSSVVFAPIELEGHTNDLAITIGYADATTGRLVEADIIVNAKKPFAIVQQLANAPNADGKAPGEDEDSGEAKDCHGAYDLQNVVTHEAGHFFGLDEDKDDKQATMFYKTGKCELHKRNLTPPDLAVMSALYLRPIAAGPETDTGAGCGGASIAGQRRSNGGGALLALLTLSLGAFVRRSRRT